MYFVRKNGGNPDDNLIIKKKGRKKKKEEKKADVNVTLTLKNPLSWVVVMWKEAAVVNPEMKEGGMKVVSTPNWRTPMKNMVAPTTRDTPLATDDRKKSSSVSPSSTAGVGVVVGSDRREPMAREVEGRKVVVVGRVMVEGAKVVAFRAAPR